MFELFYKQFTNKSILIYCDNIAVVSMLIRQACCFRRQDIMYFIRILLHLCELHNIKYVIRYVHTKFNKADAISRMVPYKQFQKSISNQLTNKPTNISDNIYKHLKKYFNMKYTNNTNKPTTHCHGSCNCPTLCVGGIYKPECFFY